VFVRAVFFAESLRSKVFDFDCFSQSNRPANPVTSANAIPSEPFLHDRSRDRSQPGEANRARQESLFPEQSNARVVEHSWPRFPLKLPRRQLALLTSWRLPGTKARRWPCPSVESYDSIVATHGCWSLEYGPRPSNGQFRLLLQQIGPMPPRSIPQSASEKSPNLEYPQRFKRKQEGPSPWHPPERFYSVYSLVSTSVDESKGFSCFASCSRWPLARNPASSSGNCCCSFRAFRSS
jgi:hypothetical protein